MAESWSIRVFWIVREKGKLNGIAVDVEIATLEHNILSILRNQAILDLKPKAFWLDGT